MKNILIPSDFSIKSLNCIDDLLCTFRNEQLNILLVHTFIMPDSISEIMSLTSRRKKCNFISPEFWNRCTQLEYENAQINSIRFECVYGSTVAVFKQFLEGQHIDLVAYPQQYQFRKLSEWSFDPARLISKSGIEVKMITTIKLEKETGLVSRKEHLIYSLPQN
ncbi:hypothetical protein GXP67_10555 [Rhodocytophaga rosea]|uniref:Universal stress protein n=1 Tax=Rhodocytophaga rosea TaxID=2704465 RepID=A0A6C0GGB8_9BACT|nr:hypothetical protein [Rhodocytophaga rosea]QHT67056.1 hypothetical protein GXP67_10555 [Rhodocytophaga rosea]